MFNIPEFGKKIRAERELRGLTLDQLQEKLNISRQTLSKWEKGQGAGPTVFDLLNMCDLFACDMGYLVGEYTERHRQTTDIVQATGLTAKAVETLRHLTQNEKDFLNVFLSARSELYFIASGFHEYLKKAKENWAIERGWISDEFDVTIQNDLDYAEFTLSNRFMKFCINQFNYWKTARDKEIK